MTKSEIRVCWDSCVIIDLLQQNEDRIADILAVLNEAKSKKVAIVVSTMAIAEVVKGKSGNDHLIDDFFNESFVHVRNVDRFVAREAAMLCRLHGINPADAIHVATALDASCYELQTYDGCGVTNRKRHLLQYDGEIKGLRIKLPHPLTSDHTRPNLPKF